MKISDWLDEKEAKQIDVSQVVLPADLSYDKVPDETIFFKEIVEWRFFTKDRDLAIKTAKSHIE